MPLLFEHVALPCGTSFSSAKQDQTMFFIKGDQVKSQTSIVLCFGCLIDIINGNKS